MAEPHGRSQGKGQHSEKRLLRRTWEHGNCLLMTPADRTSDLVIGKGDLDCVMCSSYQIGMRMNMYKDKVRRVLRLGDLKDEDSNRDKNEGGEGKGVTMTTPSTKKNATMKDKKKSATTTAVKKNEKKKGPSLPAG